MDAVPTNVSPSSFTTTSPALAYLASLSPSSRRPQRAALDTLAALMTTGTADAVEFPWHQLDFAITSALRAELADRYAPATTNRMLSALRGVLRSAWKLELMDAERYHRAADVKNVRGTRLPAGRAIDGHEVVSILRACENDPRIIGRRDEAAIAILWGTGLRRAELAAASLADLSPDLGRLVVRGKGDREREVYFNDVVKARVQQWLHVRGSAPGGLLLAVSKSGTIRPARHLSPATMRDIVVRRATEAGVPDLSTHSLRRTFATEMLDITDVLTVERLGGWKPGSGVVALYDRRPAERAKAAVESLRLPA